MLALEMIETDIKKQEGFLEAILPKSEGLAEYHNVKQAIRHLQKAREEVLEANVHIQRVS